MDRPGAKTRLPEILYIVGGEGENQEKLYFERFKELVNSIEGRKKNINFTYAEPYGGNPLCVVQRVVNRSIGKTNKLAIFDYDNMKIKFEEAIDLAVEENITLGYSNYCFDLWLILHKVDYEVKVNHQDDYAEEVKKVYGLPRDENIKRKNMVLNINSQIEMNDIIAAIKRASILKENKSGDDVVKTPNGHIYYINPDTEVHVVLTKLLSDVGLSDYTGIELARW